MIRVLLIAILLTGCSGNKSEVMLDAAETTNAVLNLKSSYQRTYQSVKDKRKYFTEFEWNVLVAGHVKIVNVHDRLSDYKNGNAKTIIVTTTELINLALPVRDQIYSMINVLDTHIDEMPIDARVNYRELTRHFYKIDGQFQRALANEDTREKAEVLLSIVRVATQILGVLNVVMV